MALSRVHAAAAKSIKAERAAIDKRFPAAERSNMDSMRASRLRRQHTAATFLLHGVAFRQAREFAKTSASFDRYAFMVACSFLAE